MGFFLAFTQAFYGGLKSKQEWNPAIILFIR